MECPCKVCNGILDDSHPFGEFVEPATAPEPPQKSIYDRLNDLSGFVPLKQQKELESIMKEVDLLDGELHEIQKKLAKRGDGTEAREVASVSEKLY